MSWLALLVGAAAPAEPAIIVTGAREPVAAENSIVSATLFDPDLLGDLLLPSVADALRLAPGVSVSTSGPRGSQTQLRIRGAEANHTLLFVDGIRFNDPAAGNEARFELLSADPLTRIEIVRGPQSALWGPEALGGVVSVETADPLHAPGLAAIGEQGTQRSSRLFGRYSLVSSMVGMSAAVARQSSAGVDSFGTGGDRDGFETLSGNFKAIHRGNDLELGLVGHWIEGRSDYDGIDPITFRRADTDDVTENRIRAVRAWAGATVGSWALRAEASRLDSVNRNRLADVPLNSTHGNRLTLGGQAARQIGGHRLVVAIDRQEEAFRARDTTFSGRTDQDRSRSLTAIVAEWRGEWNDSVVTDVALRHDAFSAFGDATSLRAAILFRPTGSLSLNLGYGEGIAQPTFYDLHGFFPGSFRGNPGLKTERARGWEAGMTWRRARWTLGLTAFTSRLDDEIIDVFDPVIFLSSTQNASDSSRRRGVEWLVEFHHSDALNLMIQHSWLDSKEPQSSGAALVREVRRPRHSGSLLAHGASHEFRWGISLAYVGNRRDRDFDVFPSREVILGNYLLASLSLARRILPEVELFGRIENGFGARYQDVVGYNTPGRTVHAGLRVVLGR